MKLTAAQVEQTAAQFEAEAVPEASPLVPELSRVFGEHTFFLGRDGLHIVDPIEHDEADLPAGRIVKIASWTDSDRTALAAHDPEFTDVIVALDHAA
jgi:hypothetical protein